MEPLDIENPMRLRTYLRSRGLIGSPEEVEVHVLEGGVSNRTVLVHRGHGRSWVLKQALGKLRVEVDWFSDPARIHREALGLRWLARLTPEGSVPTFLFEDFDHHLLGMTAVPQPHVNWKDLLLDGVVDPGIVEEFGRLLAKLHRLGDRPDLPSAFADRQFFDALRLEPYYAFTATRVPAAAPFLRRLVRTTRERSDTLVHGDYSPKNMLIHRGKCVLLDHEVVHVGDPAFDVGFGLTHLLSKAHHLAGRRERFVAAACLFWRTYDAALGHAPAWRQGLEGRVVAHALGCLLARVAGRSPLEYLTAAERVRQREVVVGLIDRQPRNVVDLVRTFGGCVS